MITCSRKCVGILGILSFSKHVSSAIHHSAGSFEQIELIVFFEIIVDISPQSRKIISRVDRTGLAYSLWCPLSSQWMSLEEAIIPTARRGTVFKMVRWIFVEQCDFTGCNNDVLLRTRITEISMQHSASSTSCSFDNIVVAPFGQLMGFLILLCRVVFGTL